MTAIDELRRSIQDQIVQIEQEADALRRALDVLGGPPVPGSAPLSTPAGAERARPRERVARRHRRATLPAVPAEALARLLGDSEAGLSTAELAECTGGDRDQILTLLRELEQAGSVRRSGERRGTRWHVITDEDRIAERAAELEARQAESVPEVSPAT